MCPVRSVTYVSGRSIFLASARSAPAPAQQEIDPSPEEIAILPLGTTVVLTLSRLTLTFRD
jgi:hypothetical protein